MSDIPEYQVLGRSRKPATEPTTARVAHAHVDLDHLSDNVLGADRDKIKQTIENLPDLYYQDEVGAVVTPDRFDRLDLKFVQQSSKS